MNEIRHVGGGWYELPGGRRVHGKAAANAAAATVEMTADASQALAALSDIDDVLDGWIDPPGKYLVVGPCAVDDIPTGGTVYIDDKARAERLTNAGHITAFPQEPPTTEPGEPS
jgi:hypothetical protein